MTLSAVCLWRTLYGESNTPVVHEQSIRVCPSQKAPAKPTMLYERDEEDLRPQWMFLRIEMFEKAYATHDLFTVSIVPKHPEVCQTWYQRRTLSDYQEEKRQDYMFESTTNTCAFPQKAQNQPRAQFGFLKPYPSFSSERYIPDPRFERIDSIRLQHIWDVEQVMREVTNEALKERLTVILSNFLKDDEAKGIGLCFHNHGTGTTKLFHK